MTRDLASLVVIVSFVGMLITWMPFIATHLTPAGSERHALAELSDASGTNEQTIKRYYMNISADVTSIRKAER